MSADDELFDAVVVGGGPAGATAASELVQAGRRVLLLDKAGRIKPCGGAIPPRLIRDFAIPDHLICAQIRLARMVSPSHREVELVSGIGTRRTQDVCQQVRGFLSFAGAEQNNGFGVE